MVVCSDLIIDVVFVMYVLVLLEGCCVDDGGLVYFCVFVDGVCFFVGFEWVFFSLDFIGCKFGVGFNDVVFD